MPDRRLLLTDALSRLRRDGRAALLWSLRVTVAATSSYVVGTLLFPGTQPLLAPLTAMLVVQVTPVSLLTAGVDRVVAVVSGCSLAVAFAVFVPLEWWSLGVLIFCSITIGQALRLRNNLVEVAISAMLILGVGALGANAAGWQRVTETLVGAFVGITANLLFPPKVPSVSAGRAIDGLADSVSGLLNRAADEVADPVGVGRDLTSAARGWLDDARRITHEIPRVGAALLRAEEGRRFNVRAVGTPNVGPGLRQGLEALEHSAVAIRSMFRAVSDAAPDAPVHDAPVHDAAAQALPGLARVFREMASCVDAFGHLVVREADPADRATSADVRSLHEALEVLQQARVRFDGLLVAGGPPQLLELHAAVLSTVKRLLSEMELDERIRRQMRLLPANRRARGRAGAPTPPRAGSPEPDPDVRTELLRGPERNRRDRRRD